jgi:hypothetical protein
MAPATQLLNRSPAARSPLRCRPERCKAVWPSGLTTLPGRGCAGPCQTSGRLSLLRRKPPSWATDPAHERRRDWADRNHCNVGR